MHLWFKSDRCDWQHSFSSSLIYLPPVAEKIDLTALVVKASFSPTICFPLLLSIYLSHPVSVFPWQRGAGVEIYFSVPIHVKHISLRTCWRRKLPFLHFWPLSCVGLNVVDYTCITSCFLFCLPPHPCKFGKVLCLSCVCSKYCFLNVCKAFWIILEPRRLINHAF